MRDAADDDTDAVALAVELDRLLARRDADGALVTETLEFVGAVSPEALFGNAKETAPVNESIAAPGSFYACRGAIAMTMECVRAVYRASAGEMRRRRSRERESSAGGARSTSSFDATKTTLCVNGDHSTAWNERKRDLMMKVFNSDAVSERERRQAVRDELAFARVVQSRWPKAPSAWAHRRWVLNQFRCQNGERNVEETRKVFEDELAACDAAILKKRMNYAAWSHRAWALTLLDEDDFATLDGEFRASEARIKRNVSDYCELHYRTRLMARFAARAKPNEYVSAIKSDVAFARELIETHPGRESLWSYLRFLYAELIAGNAESENMLDDEVASFVDKVSGKDCAARLDPSWAENSMATQRRLGVAFQSWVRIALARGRGDSCSPSFTRLTDGLTIDKW